MSYSAVEIKTEVEQEELLSQGFTCANGRCSDTASQASSAAHQAKGGLGERDFSALYLQASSSDSVEIPSLQFCRVQAASCLKASC